MPTWMNRTKEENAERIAEIRRRRQESGNCVRCGLKRDPASKQLCAEHLAADRKVQLDRYYASKGVDYSISCRCGCGAVNHRAELVSNAIIRTECLRCECKRYKPATAAGAVDPHAGTSNAGPRA
jgi:hypothetical protein